jgi:hypothetical protein
MYKRQITVIGICLFLAALLIGISICRVTEKDQDAYQDLLESSTLAKQPLISYSRQAREGVLKEIWYQSKEPLYIRIESDDSELFFFHQEGRIEIVEQLEKVVCLMQEELFFEKGKPMQHIRYMEAKHANYNYTTQLFIGEEAKLWKYCLEGHEPVTSVEGLIPIMSGTADSIEFTFKGKDVNFQARHLKATLNSKKKLL